MNRILSAKAVHEIQKHSDRLYNTVHSEITVRDKMMTAETGPGILRFAYI